MTTSAPHREVVVRSDSDKPIYTPAIRSGNFLFLSGAVGIAPEGGKLVPGGIQPETKRALARIEEILKQAGLGLGDVVKCTVFLADISEYGAMNEVYREVWPGDPPARTTVAVTPPIGARVEIECFAAYPG
jgi:reactive intermediate/imine deaminase